MKITRAGVDRSSTYLPDELPVISVTKNAWDGTVGLGVIPCPDPAGNQEPTEGQQLLLEVGATTIIDGFIGAVTTARGPSTIGVRRVHTADLGDDNALLQGHATPSWTRPAESPAARWQAFVDDFLPGTIDTTWLLTTHESGVTLPKFTYRSDSLFDDLLADTVRPTGKTVYIENRNFHWHLATEGQTCSLTIDDTTFDYATSFPPLSTLRQKDGMDIRNRIYARNDAGVQVSVSDATSITAHDAAGLKHQGYSEYGTDSSADMTRDIGVTLAERKDERQTWTYEIGPLTAAEAAELIPGSQMTVTVGLHDLSAATKRIATVKLSYRHPDSFVASVELGYPKRFRRKPTKTTSTTGSTGSGGGGAGGGGGGGGGGDCGCPPWGGLGSGDFSQVQRAWRIGENRSSATGGTPTYAVSADSDNVVPLDIGAAIGANHEPTSAFPTTEGEGRVFIQHVPPDGATAGRVRARIFAWARSSPAPTEALHWQIWQGQWDVVPGGSNTIPRALQPATDPTFFSVGGTIASGTLTPNARPAATMGAGTYVDIDVMIPCDDDGVLKFVLGFGAAQTTLNASEWAGFTTAYVGSRYPIAADRNVSDVLYMQDGTGTALISNPVTGYSVDWFPTETPKHGQTVRETIATANGSTTAYSTTYHYLPGSLRVWVDDVLETNITETDPTTGAFTFSTAPFLGEEITVEYQGTGE